MIVPYVERKVHHGSGYEFDIFLKTDDDEETNDDEETDDEMDIDDEEYDIYDILLKIASAFDELLDSRKQYRDALP